MKSAQNGSEMEKVIGVCWVTVAGWKLDGLDVEGGLRSAMGSGIVVQDCSECHDDWASNEDKGFKPGSAGNPE